jgi:hypothetical protein
MKLVPEGLSERSPARSAGLAFLKRYPSRMGRSTKCWQSLSRIRDQKPSVSIVPAGTDVSLRLIPALRAGLLSSGPSGTDFLQPPTTCAILTATS